jgi:hypothetical protein
VLQSLSLIGLLIGLVVSYAAASLVGHVVAGVVIVLSGLSGLVGAIFVAQVSRARELVLGVALIAVAAALIPASNILLRRYGISELEKNVYQDVGAAVAGCGCVVAAYSSFTRRNAGTAQDLADPEEDRRQDAP